jgi:hypothetical protein
MALGPIEPLTAQPPFWFRGSEILHRIIAYFSSGCTDIHVSKRQPIRLLFPPKISHFSRLYVKPAVRMSKPKCIEYKKDPPIHQSRGVPTDYALTSDVQLGQRVAFMGIVEKQKGHSLVVGTADASSDRFMALI